MPRNELHPSTLALLSVIPLVVCVPVEQPQPHLSHVFSRVLDQIYSPRTALAPNWTTWKQSIESNEAGIDDKCRVVLDQVERTCIELLRGGTDAISDWVHHDLVPLCSSEDDEPSTISSAPILRTSPLGIFVRKTTLALDRMDFEQLGHWSSSTEQWFTSSSSSSSSSTANSRDSPYPRLEPALTNPQELLRNTLDHFHDQNWDLLLLSLEETFKISRSVGDRRTLQGCWSLLKRIPKRYQSKFLNDVNGGGGGSGRETDRKGKNKLVQGELGSSDDGQLSNPHDILYEVYQALLSIRDDDDDNSRSISIPSLFSKLYVAQSLAISAASASTAPLAKSATSASPSSSSSPSTADKVSEHVKSGRYEIDFETFATELWFVESQVWETLGITPISKVYQDLILEGPSRGPRDVEDSNTTRPRRRQEEEKAMSGAQPLMLQDLRLKTLLNRARLLSSSSSSSSVSTSTRIRKATPSRQALELLLKSIETEPKRRSIGLSSSSSSVTSRNAFSDWKLQVFASLETELMTRPYRTTTSSKPEKEQEEDRQVGLETVRTLLSPSRTKSKTRLTPASKLSSNLSTSFSSSSSPSSPSPSATASTLSSISREIGLTLSRLELTACTAPTEAFRSLEQLEQLQNRILIFSSSATITPTASTRTPPMEEEEEEKEEEEEEEEDDNDDGKAKMVEGGEMLSRKGRRVEAKYWKSLAQTRIVASDYKDQEIKLCLDLFEKSYEIYRSLSLWDEALEVKNLLESVSVHLSLLPFLSTGEQSEWKRRAERYRLDASVDEDEAAQGDVEVVVDWRKVLGIVETVESLISLRA